METMQLLPNNSQVSSSKSESEPSFMETDSNFKKQPRDESTNNSVKTYNKVPQLTEAIQSRTESLLIKLTEGFQSLVTHMDKMERNYEIPVQNQHNNNSTLNVCSTLVLNSPFTQRNQPENRNPPTPTLNNLS